MHVLAKFIYDKNVDIHVRSACGRRCGDSHVNRAHMHVKRMQAAKGPPTTPTRRCPWRPCHRLAPETVAFVLLRSQRLPSPPPRRQVRLARRVHREREALALALFSSAHRAQGVHERPVAATRSAGRW